MTPEELRETAARWGFQVSDRTIRHYAQHGVIPKPKRRGLGRGRGVASEYPPEAAAELVAAQALIGSTLFPREIKGPGGRVFRPTTLQRQNIITLKDIAEVRRFAYEMTAGEAWEEMKRTGEGEESLMRGRVALLALWLSWRYMVLSGREESQAIGLHHIRDADPGVKLVDIRPD